MIQAIVPELIHNPQHLPALVMHGPVLCRRGCLWGFMRCVPTRVPLSHTGQPAGLLVGVPLREPRVLWAQRSGRRPPTTVAGSDRCALAEAKRSSRSARPSCWPLRESVR